MRGVVGVEEEGVDVIGGRNAAALGRIWGARTLETSGLTGRGAG